MIREIRDFLAGFKEAAVAERQGGPAWYRWGVPIGVIIALAALLWFLIAADGCVEHETLFRFSSFSSRLKKMVSQLAEFAIQKIFPPEGWEEATVSRTVVRRIGINWDKGRKRIADARVQDDPVSCKSN